jgi:hypothetical protein
VAAAMVAAAMVAAAMVVPAMAVVPPPPIALDPTNQVSTLPYHTTPAHLRVYLMGYRAFDGQTRPRFGICFVIFLFISCDSCIEPRLICFLRVLVLVCLLSVLLLVHPCYPLLFCELHARIRTNL